MERVCDRVIVLHRGRVLVDQSLDALRREHIRRKLLILHTVEAECEIALAGTRIVERRPHRVALEVDLTRVQVDQVVQYVMSRARLQDLTVSDPPMEEIISELYAKAAGTKAPPVASGAALERVAS